MDKTLVVLSLVVSTCMGGQHHLAHYPVATSAVHYSSAPVVHTDVVKAVYHAPVVHTVIPKSSFAYSVSEGHGAATTSVEASDHFSHTGYGYTVHNVPTYYAVAPAVHTVAPVAPAPPPAPVAPAEPAHVDVAPAPVVTEVKAPEVVAPAVVVAPVVHAHVPASSFAYSTNEAGGFGTTSVAAADHHSGTSYGYTVHNVPPVKIVPAVVAVPHAVTVPHKTFAYSVHEGHGAATVVSSADHAVHVDTSHHHVPTAHVHALPSASYSATHVTRGAGGFSYAVKEGGYVHH